MSTSSSNTSGTASTKNIFERPTKPERRVVVTGMGMITPLGVTMDESWRSAIAGRSGIDTITQFDAGGFDAKFAGEVKGFDANLYIEKKEQKKMDRFIHLSMAAADMAIKDSGLDFSGPLGDHTGVFIGGRNWRIRCHRNSARYLHGARAVPNHAVFYSDGHH